MSHAALLARVAPPLLAVLTLAWVAALAWTPAARAGGGAARIVGTVIHAGSSRICHQQPERSFQRAGVPWPVCGRCAGLYAGAAAGAWAAWASLRWRARRGAPVPPPAAWRLPLLAAAVPTALTWGLEAAGLAGTTTGARFLAALPLGALATWAVAHALAHDGARGLH